MPLSFPVFKIFDIFQIERIVMGENVIAGSPNDFHRLLSKNLFQIYPGL
jgi:hypothetical protein